MNTIGAFIGLIVGGIVGAIIGRFNIYISLNKTNLIGDDDFGQEELKKGNGVLTDVCVMILGAVFAMAGMFVISLTTPSTENIREIFAIHTSTAGTILFGIIMILFGVVAFAGAVLDLLKNK